MTIDLNWVDLGFIIFCLLSITFGFIRGFIRSAVSLFFLVAAVYLALKYSPLLVAHYVGPTSHDQTISYLSLIGIFLLIFIVTIFIGAIISYFLNTAFQLTGLGVVNSFFGGVFGLVRAVIISIFVIYLAQLSPLANQSMWQQSQSVRYAQPMVAWLEKNLSPQLTILKGNMNKVQDNQIKGIIP